MESFVEFRHEHKVYFVFRKCGCILAALGLEELNARIACPEHREEVVKIHESEEEPKP